MMKTFAWAGAAAVLMVAGAAQAQTGYVGVSHHVNNGSDLETNSVGGALAIGSNFQIDAHYGSIEGDADTYGIGGHYFVRNDQYLIGGYLGYDVLDTDFGFEIEEYTVAGQGQYYVDNFTLSGTLAYTQTTDYPFAGDIDTISFETEGRWFASDNLSFALGGGGGSYDTDFGSDEFWTMGVDAEWKPAALPVSLFVGADATDGLGDASTYQVGVRYIIGGGTLLERNRSGAGLETPTGFLSRVF